MLFVLVLQTGFANLLKAQKVQSKLNNGVSMSLSMPMRQLTENERVAFAKRSEIRHDTYELEGEKSIYVLDGMILTFIKRNETRDLDQLKKSFDSFSKSVESSTPPTRLIADHGYRILISDFSVINKYNIIAVHPTKKVYITAYLDFNPSKKEAAKEVLNEIISSISFE